MRHRHVVADEVRPYETGGARERVADATREVPSDR
jgi:hypothetical protein